jgi:hypothetical protein
MTEMPQCFTAVSLDPSNEQEKRGNQEPYSSHKYSQYLTVVLKSLLSPIDIGLPVSSRTAISPLRRSLCHFRDRQSAFAPLEVIVVSAVHVFLDLPESFLPEDVELNFQH